MAQLRRFSLLAAVGIVCSASAIAQTNPLATVSGRVADPAGAPLDGVAIAASSPALQGVRETTTTVTGDYLIPFLPPGEYEIVFRREGFGEARATRSLRGAETSRLDLELELAGLTEEITISDEPASVMGRDFATSTTYSARLLDLLPVDRSMLGAMELAPGVGANLRIAGAGTYENLYLVDGVGVREIVGGSPRPFPVEDAIEEITTTVASISAEYGRFTGGMVNAVTRSGGDKLRASLRVRLESEAWRSLTPYERGNLEEDPRESAVVPIYEGTFGGPLLRGRLWYFLAGRLEERSSAQTLAFTDLPYQSRSEETRFEGKLTWAPRAAQSLRVGWSEIDTRGENLAGFAMDYAALSSVTTPEDLLSIHYSAALGRDLFFESQLSRRRRAPTGGGARTTDLIAGTELFDGSTGASWHSPHLCGVCGVPEGELRKAEEGDRGFVAKASRLFSGARAGAHHLVVGGELYEEGRKSNAFQSGSSYVVTATSTVLENGEVFPVFAPDGSTVIQWRPIFELSEGSRFRTSSAFINDDWRLGERWSFNLGLRWDADLSRDQSGAKVGQSDAWSPRLGAAFDPRGDGVWRVDGGWARYVTSLNHQLGDFGSGAGRSSNFSYTYFGPPINEDSDSGLVATDEALATLFDWFFANGGTSRPYRGAPTVPGLNRIAGEHLAPPVSDELTLGVSRRIGERGFVRISGLRRDFSRQYIERADTTTGQIVDPYTGRRYDLRLLENGGRVERSYEALLVQLDLRLRPELRLAGSYTLSSTRGNFDGDGSDPEGNLYLFPEYGEKRWRAPTGALLGEQRHRLRLWASWELPLAERWGAFSVSVLERLDSGGAWNAVAEIDPRPYVTNPGYAVPPAGVPYAFERPGAHRFETATASDLAIHHAVRPRALKGIELFARVVVLNLFDQSAQVGLGETGVLTATDDPELASFDPFREQPVRGVHWNLVPEFGEPISAEDYQQPRTFSLSFGLRF